MVPSLYKETANLKSQTSAESEIAVIKRKVIDITNLVSSTSLLKKNLEKERKKEKENKKREEKENRLEKKDNKIIPKAPSFNLPKLGFLDAINRFITFTLLGWAFKRIYPYFPQILGFIKNIDPVIKFIETLSGNFFKGVVDFIDFGYKAHDTVRDFTKKLGGEPFQKAFDDFSKNLNTFINLALIAGMLSTGGPDFRRPATRPGGRPGGRPRITGDTGGPNLRNPLRERPKITGDVGGAAKNVGRLSKLGRFGLPIVGGLIDFGIRTIIFKEPVDRAAAGAVGFSIGQALGSWIGGAIGTVAGTVIPVIGNLLGGAAGAAVGGILGGMLGDLIGTSLLDTIKFYQSKKQPVNKQAGGGKVTTRKGKVVGGAVKRTVRKVTAPLKSKQVKPGASVGGEKKIKQIYPEPPKNQIGKMMNPYGLLTDTTKEMGTIPFLGPIFNIFGKTLLGDPPTKDDYRIIGSSINAWINNAISKGTLQGNLMSAFADGGVVDIGNEMKKNISGWVEKSVEELVRNKVTDAINKLRKNLGMEPIGDQTTPSITGDPLAEGATATGIGLMNGLIQRGFTKEESAAIVGNLWAESSFRPNALNTTSGAFGLMQWTQGRKARLYSYAAEKGKSVTDVDLQLDYIKWELKGGNAYETAQFQRAMSYGPDVESKTRGFAEQVERASARELSASMSKRLGAAQSVYSGKGVPGEKPPLGKITGNLKAAQDLATSMGLTMTSGMYWSDGRRRTGLHGAGRALDFSNGIDTPQQMAFANEVIKRYGKSLEQLIYTPLGYGISKGTIVNLDYWGDKVNSEHRNHVHVAFKKGGVIGEQKVKPLQKQAFYEEGQGDMIYILPIRIKEQVPVSMQNNRTSFPGGLNRSMSSRVPMR